MVKKQYELVQFSFLFLTPSSAYTQRFKYSNSDTRPTLAYSQSHVLKNVKRYKFYKILRF